VKYERVCEREAKPVPWEQIVKGYEYEKGQYAVLTKEDFKRAALEKTDTIDVLSFVPASAIDTRFFETPYYVVPGKGADRAYALLRETIRNTGKVGVAQLILRQSQHLAALSVKDDVFVLTLLRLADDLAATDSIKTPSGKGLRDNELKLGRAAGRRARGSVEAGAVQGSIRGEPVRDHRGEDQGQGGEAPPGRDRSGRAEGRGGGPDGAPAPEPVRQHQRAREAAPQEDRRPDPPSRGVNKTPATSFPVRRSTATATVPVPFKTAQAAGDLNVVIVGWTNNNVAQLAGVVDSRGNAYQLAVGPTVTGNRAQVMYYAAKHRGGPGRRQHRDRHVQRRRAERRRPYPGVQRYRHHLPAGRGRRGERLQQQQRHAGIDDDKRPRPSLSRGTTSPRGPSPQARASRRGSSPIRTGDIAEDRVVTATGSYTATAPLGSAGAWIMQMVAFRAR
jgi:DNA end-binding protein Ku